MSPSSSCVSRLGHLKRVCCITRTCSGSIDKAIERGVETPQPKSLSIAAELGVRERRSPFMVRKLGLFARM